MTSTDVKFLFIFSLKNLKFRQKVKIIWNHLYLSSMKIRVVFDGLDTNKMVNSLS